MYQANAVWSTFGQNIFPSIMNNTNILGIENALITFSR